MNTHRQVAAAATNGMWIEVIRKARGGTYFVCSKGDGEGIRAPRYKIASKILEGTGAVITKCFLSPPKKPIYSEWARAHPHLLSSHTQSVNSDGEQQ